MYVNYYNFPYIIGPQLPEKEINTQTEKKRKIAHNDEDLELNYIYFGDSGDEDDDDELNEDDSDWEP